MSFQLRSELSFPRQEYWSGLPLPEMRSLEWALNLVWPVSLGKRRLRLSRHESIAMSKIGREVLEETKPTDTSISDFQPPELWEIHCCEAVLFVVLVMVAVTNMTSSCGSQWLILMCRLPCCKLENLILTIAVSLVFFGTGLYCECGEDILSLGNVQLLQYASFWYLFGDQLFFQTI